MDRNAGCSIVKSDILIRKWLYLPDGCASRDGRWIAVSNHNTHGVLLYDRSVSLNEDSSPVGVLRGVSFPHGMRFSADGRHLFLADAGAPFVHVYAYDGQGWHGRACRLHRYGSWTIRFSSRPEEPARGRPKGHRSRQEHDRARDHVRVSVPAVPGCGGRACRGFVGLAGDGGGVRARCSSGRCRKGQGRGGEAAGPRRRRGERRIRELELLAAHHERGRAEKFKAKAARQKAKAARAKARAGLVISGGPWRITAPLSRLFTHSSGQISARFGRFRGPVLRPD